MPRTYERVHVGEIRPEAAPPATPRPLGHHNTPAPSDRQR